MSTKARWFGKRSGSSGKASRRSRRPLAFEPMEPRELMAVMTSPVAGLQTSEDGQAAVVSYWLSSEPKSNVTIELRCSQPGEGKLAVTKLTFTRSNWDKAQTVRINGVSDGVIDGNRQYQILGTAVSNDPRYSDRIHQGRLVPAVNVTNLDSPTLVAGIKVTATSQETNKAGAQTTIDVTLGYQPTKTITVPVVVSDPRQATVSKKTLTFTSKNWNVPQTVTVTGLDDGVFGDVAYKITFGPAANPGDPKYVGKKAEVALVNRDFRLTNLDDEAKYWNVATDEGTSVCRPPTNIESPATVPPALLLGILGGTPNSNCHYYRDTFGVDHVALKTFTLSMDFRFDPTTFNDKPTDSTIQALEFSFSRWSGNRRWEIAVQWRVVGDGAPGWFYWDPSRAKPERWVRLELPPGFPKELTGDTWYHLSLTGTLVGNDVHYTELAVHKVEHVTDGSTAVLNVTAPSVAVDTTPDRLSVAIQLDGTQTMTPYDVIVDRVDLFAKR